MRRHGRHQLRRLPAAHRRAHRQRRQALARNPLAARPRSLRHHRSLRLRHRDTLERCPTNLHEAAQPEGEDALHPPHRLHAQEPAPLRRKPSPVRRALHRRPPSASPTPTSSRARSSATTTSSTSDAGWGSPPSSTPPTCASPSSSTPTPAASGRRDAARGLPARARSAIPSRLRRRHRRQPHRRRPRRRRRWPSSSSRPSSRPSSPPRRSPPSAHKKNLRVLRAASRRAEARAQADLRRLPAAGRGSRQRHRRGPHLPHATQAHHRRDRRPALRLEGLQARQVQRHRLCALQDGFGRPSASAPAR